MPRVAPDAGARILQRLVLESGRIEADRVAVRQEEGAIGRDEVGERAAQPDVAVQPEAAVDREDHPVAAAGEFSNGWDERRNARHARVPLSCRRRLPER